MATNNCGTPNCGCSNTSYTVTPPCPPACPEVFNSSCIVYTGTDIICNQDTVISRYDYLDTIITKLVNYICNVQAPITEVVGSEYIDVVPATVGNVTTYTVSIDVPALQAYFDTVFQNDILSSILAGPGILVSQNPIVGTVTISHEDTSTVANVNSDNLGNTFIQDVFFTFDTYGHVTGASVVPGTVIPQNTFDRATINPDSGFVWGPDNDPTNIQIADAANDALNFVAGTGIILNASTVPSTDAIRITNSAPDQTVVLNEGTGIDVTGTYPNFTIANTDPGSAVTLTSAGIATESLVNDGVGPALATKGLKANTGISLTSTATDITITNTAPNVDQFLWLTFEGDTGVAIAATTTTDVLTVAGANGIVTNTAGTTLTITSPVNRDDSSVTAQAITATVPVVGLTHTLGKQFVSLTIIDTGSNTDVTREFYPILTGVGTYNLVSPTFTGTVRVLAIG